MNRIILNAFVMYKVDVNLSCITLCIQGCSKGHVQKSRVDVPGHEEQELHKNWGSETRS